MKLSLQLLLSASFPYTLPRLMPSWGRTSTEPPLSSTSVARQRGPLGLCPTSGPPPALAVPSQVMPLRMCQCLTAMIHSTTSSALTMLECTHVLPVTLMLTWEVLQLMLTLWVSWLLYWGEMWRALNLAISAKRSLADFKFGNSVHVYILVDGGV